MRGLAILAAALAALWAGFALVPGYEGHAHRFRLTIEADTPEGVRSASNVIEVERRDRRGPLPGLRLTFHVRGEAVFLDLGGGRNVVAVFAHGDNAEWIDQLISLWVEAYGRKRWDEDVWSGRAELRGEVELAPPLIPTLVTFTDPFDPATVRAVPPRAFEEVFGPGFRFLRATLEVVPNTVPETTGIIEKRLPWLVGLTTSLAGTTIALTNDLPERLNARRFIRQDP